MYSPSLDNGDTLSVFEGNPETFLPFTPASLGEYTITYTLDLGILDDFDYDNVLVSTFKVNQNVLSLARIDGSEVPIASDYPFNHQSEYQSCMFFVAEDASAIGVKGVTFYPYIDTDEADLVGEEVFLNIYEWNDPWVDLADPAYSGATNNNNFYTQLNPIVLEAYVFTSNSQVEQPNYIPVDPFVFTDDQRYLVCMQSNTDVVFGYDRGLDHSAAVGIYRMPVAPIHTDGVWFNGGWRGYSTPSIALDIFNSAEMGIETLSSLEGQAYPNPANDAVMIAVNASGEATLNIVDLSGKIVMQEALVLVDGKAQVDIRSLDEGLYIFNLTLLSGETSQFSVVKN